jgi:hypothetical protein
MENKEQIISLVLAEYADKIAIETINNIKKDTSKINFINGVENKVLKEVLNILTKKLK